ncbi:unnamed protein product, partial [marine sediment metagenome]
MEDQFYIFDPGTLTSKCPMPTRFDHATAKVQGWLEREKVFELPDDLIDTIELAPSNRFPMSL